MALVNVRLLLIVKIPSARSISLRYNVHDFVIDPFYIDKIARGINLDLYGNIIIALRYNVAFRNSFY